MQDRNEGDFLGSLRFVYLQTPEIYSTGNKVCKFLSSGALALTVSTELNK